MQMRRGTTPYVLIETDVDLTRAKYSVLTIEDRAGAEVDVDSRSGMLEVFVSGVRAKLTQAQTLSLTKGPLKLQLRAVDERGNAIASGIMTGQMEDVLKDGEIGG